MESCKAAAKSGMPLSSQRQDGTAHSRPRDRPRQAPTAAEESKAKKTRAMGVDYVGLWNIGITVCFKFYLQADLEPKTKLNILMSLPSKPSNLCMNRNA